MGGLIGKLSPIVKEYRVVRVVNDVYAHVSIHRLSPIGRPAMEIICRRESVQYLASKIRILCQQVSSEVQYQCTHHPCFLCSEADFTEWSAWSDCSGIACQFGQQQRRRSCLKTALCNGEQIQERDCAMPCAGKNPSSVTKPGKSSAVMYSNWTDWSACPSVDCTSIRSRQCLQQRVCLEPLVESRVCPDNHLCLRELHLSNFSAIP